MANPLVETYLNETNMLDVSNYVNWKFKLQNLMEGCNVWLIESGKERKPNVTIGATTINSRLGEAGE